MKSGTTAGWWFATEDGRLKVSSVGEGKVCVELYQPGSGFGPMEQPDQRMSVTIAVEAWTEIAVAVQGAAGGSPPKRTP